MPKYTDVAGDLSVQVWLKRVANEMAENNRLLRIFMKNYKGIGDQDSTTQDDNA